MDIATWLVQGSTLWGVSEATERQEPEIYEEE